MQGKVRIDNQLFFQRPVVADVDGAHTVRIGESILQFKLNPHQALGVGEKLLALVGQHRAGRQTVEQRTAHFFFQRRNLLADGGLGDVHVLRSGGEAAFANDGEKIRDSVGVHAKRPPLGTKNSLPRCAEGSKDASG